MQPQRNNGKKANLPARETGAAVLFDGSEQSRQIRTPVRNISFPLSLSAFVP
jgi:hypothetical protein